MHPCRAVLVAVAVVLLSATGGNAVSAAPAGKPKVHTVHLGQHLGMIARRYHVTVESICAANELRCSEAIQPGQRLYIPPSDDPDGSRTRAYRDERDQPPATSRAADSRPSWKRYAKPAWRRGFVTLVRSEETWRGYVVDRRGKVLPGARDAFSRMLATADGRRITMAPRLVQLVAQVSDTFGGRPIRVVSGYRVETASLGSRHRVGKAIDFALEGVPNSALRDYLKTLSDVGVGFYPSSSFVHLDVRDQWTYWVDYSGPGEPARYGGFWTKP